MNEVVIPSNEADREKIMKSIEAISDSMTRIEGEKNWIKEEIAAVSEATKIPKKFLNKLARTYHKQNFDNVMKEVEDFEALYDVIVKGEEDANV